MNIAHTLAELKMQLDRVLETSGFELNRIDFVHQDAWIFQNGMMSHKSGGYFHVMGVQDQKREEVNLFYFQPQSAITGVLIHVTRGEIYVLTQARIEPGNTGVLQLGPTIQSTPANFLRMHGGKGTSYLNYFYTGQEHVIGFNSSNHLDIGKLFFQKSKLLNYALVDRFIDTDDSFIWVPITVLKEAAEHDYLVNTDLRSLMGVYNWDSLSDKITQSDVISSDILSYYIKVRSSVNTSRKIVPIDQCDDICITDSAIFARHESDTEIGLFSIKTKHREVSEWVQPLWTAKDKGKVLLLCRNWDNEKKMEFLLTVKPERGVAGGYNICPTRLLYPQEVMDNHFFDVGNIKQEFYQSDEGGRFINHEYLFRVSEVTEPLPIQDNQFWVSASELKNILSMHNVPSIQLRNICSVIIDKLNPAVFQ